MVGAIVLYYYYNLLVRTLHAIRNGLFGAFDLLPAKLINTAKRKLVHKERVVPQKVTEKRGATCCVWVAALVVTYLLRLLRWVRLTERSDSEPDSFRRRLCKVDPQDTPLASLSASDWPPFPPPPARRLKY